MILEKSFRLYILFLRRFGSQWMEVKVPQLSAALAYYSIFSMAPLLVIVIACTGWAFGPEAVRGHLDDELRSYVGQSAAQTIQSMIQSTYQPGGGMWATLLAIMTLLIGATGFFSQLKDALNTIWNTSAKSSLTIMALLKERLVSFGMVLVMGFLMLVSLLLSTAIAATWKWMVNYLPLSQILLGLIGMLVSFCLITSLFAFIFKWLPDTRVKWNQVWGGAIFSASLFEIGKQLLGFYLGRESTASSYGAAGAVILILLWMYYTSIILLSGAVLTRVYHRKCLTRC